jgi:Peroxiredoxin
MATAAKSDDFSLGEGDGATEINLPTDNGGHINSAELKGEKNIVVYFYPKDDTPGCTAEAKDFRDHLGAFDAADTVIIGISKDSVASHDKFKNKHELNFHLASDEDGDVCERFGVWVEKNMYGKKYMGIQRATFLISKDGSIAKAWPKVKVLGHVEEVLEAARSL